MTRITTFMPWRPVVLLLFMAVTWSTSHAAMAAGSDYVVKANILAGTCSVTVTPDTPSMPTVSPELLTKGALLSVTPVQVTFACSGSADDKTPTLSVSGSTLGSTGYGQYLFRDPASEVSGAGFVLSTDSDTAWDTSKFISGPDSISLGAAGTTYDGSGRQFWVGVGCGGVQECASHVGQDDAGMLKAAIRFTFAYK